MLPVFHLCFYSFVLFFSVSGVILEGLFCSYFEIYKIEEELTLPSIFEVRFFVN